VKHSDICYMINCQLPRRITKLTSYGDRSFSVHGPFVWNSLPNELRLSDMSLETFRYRLKAFLFGHWSFDSPFAAVHKFGLYK